MGPVYRPADGEPMCGAQDPDPLFSQHRCLMDKGHGGAVHKTFTKTWRVEGVTVCSYCEHGMCDRRPCLDPVRCNCDHLGRDR